MKADDQRHGTNAGYQAHHKWDVPMCEPCRTAHAKQHQQFRNRRYLQRLDRLLVDPGPTVRRVRALQAIGWTLRHIDQELGGSGSNGVWNMLHQPSIHVDTAAKVSQIYDSLHMTPGPSMRTRGLAAKRGWLPPLAYEDIDTNELHVDTYLNNIRDDVDPVVVRRVLEGDTTVAKAANPAEREEIVRRWSTETGRTLGELERLTSWNVARYNRRLRAKAAA